jgi:hypothetical protein
MPDKKVDPFKIGDSHRPGMSKPVQTTAAKRAENQEPQAFSLGFARIETMLEREDPDQVGEGLSNILKDLKALGEKAKANKDKLAVKKATAAVERAVDLMDYLFQTKAVLEDNIK